jgi:hypothetical protein
LRDGRSARPADITSSRKFRSARCRAAVNISTYITVDSGARRVYLSHGTEVKVLDADSSVEVGAITGFERSHGVALAPDLGRGFVSDGDLGEAVIFDLKTFKTLGLVKSDEDADSILYDPASKHIFVFNGPAKERDGDRSREGNCRIRPRSSCAFRLSP